MTNVKAVEFRPTVNDDLVEMLEELLARAKSGGIVSGTFCGITKDDAVCSRFSRTHDRVREIAALSHLLYRLHSKLEAKAAPVP